MPDWTKSMQQTYEFYKVDPNTWGNKEEITDAISCTITRDTEDELLETLSLNVSNLYDECYVRVYLVTIQNGIKEKHPLGTFMIQTPETDYNGRVQNISMDGYSPLIELKDCAPPYGYTIMKDTDVLTTVADLTSEHTRAPVLRPESGDKLPSHFISEFDNDSWLSFLSAALSSIKYRYGLDEIGRVIFEPVKNPNAAQPVWTYSDDNSSILQPEIKLSRDLYGVPNVVEVLYSDDNGYKLGRAENHDENSPISIPVRGRVVLHRENNPEGLISPTQGQIDNYAEELLRDLSSLEYTVTYSHGYCPVRVGDCVMLNYKRAGIVGVKAIVKQQTINCKTGCEVNETAVFTKKLWG